MAGRRALQAVGPSYQLADRKAAAQRTINMRLREIAGLGEDRSVILESVPGLTSFADLGATVRGLYATESRLFAATSTTLHEVSASGALTPRGSIVAPDAAEMVHGRDQLAIACGVNGYVLNLASNTLTQITSEGWRGSNRVAEIDGYFIFAAPDSDQFYLSAIDDATTLDALDFSSADARPDRILWHGVLHAELVLLGERSGEFWVDSGAADFPLTRYTAAPMDYGIAGKRAAALAADTLFWCGQSPRGNGTVYALSGHSPVRVSTDPVEEALRGDGVDLSQCVLWAYETSGAEYVGVTAPGMSTTWVYDCAAKQWHERAEMVAGAWAPLRVDRVVQFAGMHIAACGTKLCKVDPDAYTLDGDPLIRERTWPHLIAPTAEMVGYRSLELACTTGLGGNVTLEISNDGGSVFGPPLPRSLGAIGRRMERVRWHMLGSSRDRVFRLRCSDAVPFSIYSAQVDAA